MGRKKGSHNKPLTQEQIEDLRKNRYVKSVSATTVRFTEEFKRYFYHKKTSGVIARDIFLECGIDPDILGQRRIDGFRQIINNEAKREDGFIDRRNISQHHSSVESCGTLESRIRQLEHELAYTRQEVEFLKKLQQADMEARRLWESKHQPK